MWRLHTTVTLFFVCIAWSIGAADEVKELSRQAHLLKAASHLEAAGLSNRAMKIRRVAMTDELRARVDGIKKSLSRVDGLLEHRAAGSSLGFIIDPKVLADALDALRRLQDHIEVITKDLSVATDKVARNPKMLMLTPGQNLVDEQEEKPIRGK